LNLKRAEKARILVSKITGKNFQKSLLVITTHRIKLRLKNISYFVCASYG